MGGGGAPPLRTRLESGFSSSVMYALCLTFVQSFCLPVSSSLQNFLICPNLLHEKQRGPAFRFLSKQHFLRLRHTSFPFIQFSFFMQQSLSNSFYTWYGRTSLLPELSRACPKESGKLASNVTTFSSSSIATPMTDNSSKISVISFTCFCNESPSRSLRLFNLHRRASLSAQIFFLIGYVGLV